MRRWYRARDGEGQEAGDVDRKEIGCGCGCREDVVRRRNALARIERLEAIDLTAGLAPLLAPRITTAEWPRMLSFTARSRDRDGTDVAWLLELPRRSVGAHPARADAGVAGERGAVRDSLRSRAGVAVGAIVAGWPAWNARRARHVPGRRTLDSRSRGDARCADPVRSRQHRRAPTRPSASYEDAARTDRLARELGDRRDRLARCVYRDDLELRCESPPSGWRDGCPEMTWN